MSGNPVFRGTRVPVHLLAELVPSRVADAPIVTPYRSSTHRHRQKRTDRDAPKSRESGFVLWHF